MAVQIFSLLYYILVVTVSGLCIHWISIFNGIQFNLPIAFNNPIYNKNSRIFKSSLEFPSMKIQRTFVNHTLNLTIFDHKSENQLTLWRSVAGPNGMFNDRIIEQYKWIEQFTRQRKLDPIKRKSIIIFDGGMESLKGINETVCLGFDIHKLCKIMKGRSAINVNLSKYDAAVFGYVYKPTNKITNLLMPQHVKQIIYHEEASWRTDIDFKLNNAISATYFSGSDIVVPYGKWLPYDNTTENLLPQSTYVQKNIDYAKRKTGFAVVYMSNCGRNFKGFNGRLRFIDELRKFIPIDIYGKCGTKKDNCTASQSQYACLRKTVGSYKFYLAFENSNCRDYITEKVFRNAYGTDTIPIVLGAHPDDYKKLLPPHSYIHVEDFGAFDKFTNYLKLLDENDSLYNSYFDWKGTGQFYYGRPKYICRICGMLFYDEYERHHPNYAKDAKTNFKEINRCLSSNTWYWNKQN